MQNSWVSPLACCFCQLEAAETSGKYWEAIVYENIQTDNDAKYLWMLRGRKVISKKKKDENVKRVKETDAMKPSEQMIKGKKKFTKKGRWNEKNAKELIKVYGPCENSCSGKENDFTWGTPQLRN